MSPIDPTGVPGSPQDPDAIKQIAKSYSDTFQNVEATGKEAFTRMFAQIKTVEEQYLRQVRGSQQSRFKELMRQRDELIEKIKEQSQLEIDIIKRTSDSEQYFAKASAEKRLELANKIKQVELSYSKDISEARKKAWLDQHPVISRELGQIGQETKNLASTIFGSTAGWVGLIVALAGKAIAQTSDIARTAATLRGAGFSAGINPGTSAIGTQIFSPVKGALGLTQAETNELTRTLATAPKAFYESLKNNKPLNDFIKAAGNFGVTIDKSVQTLADTSNSYGLSATDLNDILVKSKGITDATKINFNDVFNTMLRTVGTMRLLTFNTNAATDTVKNLIFPLKQLGMQSTEVQQFTESFTTVIASMSPTKLAGLFALGKGRLPSAGELEGAAGRAPLGLLVDAFKPVLENFKPGSFERTAALESLAGKFGFSTQTTSLKALSSIIDNYGKNQMGAQKAYEDFLKAPANTTLDELQRQGLDILINAKGPFELIIGKLTSLVDSVVNVIQPAVVSISHDISGFSIGDIFKGHSTPNIPSQSLPQANIQTRGRKSGTSIYSSDFEVNK